MKLSALLILILCFAKNDSYSQTSVYHPFPEDSVVWRLDCGGLGFFCNCNCSGPVCVNVNNRQYYYGADTVISGTTYHDLYLDIYNMDYWIGPGTCNPSCNASPNFYSSTAQYAGGIRQDISLKKIYFYPAGGNAEELLYDFDLSLGDTLPLSYCNLITTNKVNKIDSVLIGQNYHSRYWLWDYTMGTPSPQDSGYVALIEGIGSTYGLLEPWVMPFEFYCGLSCVSIDSVTVYPMNGTSCNWLTAGISVPAGEKLTFTASPNPANESTMISWNGNFSEIVVSDVTGRQLAVFRDIPQKENDNQLELDLRTWPAGIYLVRGTNSNGRSASVKVVKK